MKTILSVAMMGMFLFTVGCGPKAQAPAAAAPAPAAAPTQPSAVPGAPPA
jgi:hypothetical protein